MPRPAGLRCLRCRAEFPAGALFKGCLRCRASGRPTNLTVVYDEADLRKALDQRDPAAPATMWRYHALLPLAAESERPVTMGEGWTPLVPAPRLGRKLGIPGLWLKDESRNPTGSFKDRLASAAVSVARAMGYRVITGSSSGNAGAATAAFAARAGLPCVMFTTTQFPLAMKTQMAVYGTLLVAAPTIADRWTLVEEGVDRYGWFPVTVFSSPYFGSNCYGIEGYKTIGYEIIDQLGQVPQNVVFPVGAGDAFAGAWKGFTEYRDLGITDEVPKLHAAEVHGPLEHALRNNLEDCTEMPAAPEPSAAMSVATTISTYQALNVLRRSGGGACSATNTELLETQRQLASLEGIYVEASSALSVAALPRLISRGHVDPGSTTVAVLTSTGLKDPQLTADHLPPIPSCSSTLDSALAAIMETYGTAPELLTAGRAGPPKIVGGSGPDR